MNAEQENKDDQQDSVKSIGKSLDKSKGRCNSGGKAEKMNHACTTIEKWPGDLKGDCSRISLLIFLYILQSIPLSFAETIPLILQNKGVTYDEQALFSFVHWPWLIKILWAPLADAIPPNKFGKRKTFIVPIQYILGIIMLVISMNLDRSLGDLSTGERPNMFLLTLMFLPCYTLASMQDVAVDGWAITMLSPKNVGLSSTCMVVGSGIGGFLGYVVTITLDSSDFCNKWLRSTPQPVGIVPLSYSIGFYGIVFIITTTLIAILKREEKLLYENEEEISMSTKQSYMVLWEVVKLEPVWEYFVLMMGCGIVFSTCIAVAPLKFIEIGVPREKFAVMDVPLIPIHIGLPFLLSRFAISNRPMNLLVAVVPYWLITGILTGVLIYIGPMCKINDEFPNWYFGMLFLLYTFQQTIRYCKSVSITSFDAQASDPRCASTYVTFMHTVANIGGTIPGTVAIWLVNRLTWKYCTVICLGDTETCIQEETCEVIVDGFYVEIFVCTIFGVGWLMWAKKGFNKLHNLKRSTWLLKSSFFRKYK